MDHVTVTMNTGTSACSVSGVATSIYFRDVPHDGDLEAMVVSADSALQMEVFVDGATSNVDPTVSSVQV